jgi:putative flippase GtrA
MSINPSVTVFIKAQLSAFLGGSTDYVVMILLTEFLHIHYTISILISAAFGAIVNFTINKFWSFKSSWPYSSTHKAQVFKFSFVVAGSILLKSSGTYFITTGLHLDYRISRLIIDSFVSYGFNFPLIKLWMFKTIRKDHVNDEQCLFI